jgi:Undecaprenyl-phosphate galactose phosphotransferase WbaP
LSELERYERLDILDRHAAETLNEYCRIKTSVGVAAAKLANVSFYHKLFASIPLAISDFCAFFFSLMLANAVIHQLFATAGPHFQVNTVVFTSLILLPIAHLGGLYPGIGLNQAIEFRQLARSLFASLLVISIIGMMFLDVTNWHYPIVALLAYVVSLPALVTARFVGRKIASIFPSWGVATFLVATPERGVELFRRLKERPELGFRPIGLLLDPDQYWGDKFESDQIQGVPIYDIRYTDQAALQHKVTWVVVSSCANRAAAPTLDPTLAAIPNRVMLSSNQLDFGLWDRPCAIGSTNGIWLGGSSPSWFSLVMKRAIDFSLTLIALVVFFPVVILLCLLVKLSSRGPIFYSQKRVGKGGKEFKAWKFRTMLEDADRILDQHLIDDPVARQEWDQKRKLTNDPRVTAVGRILRATSIDELPQLWNVLKGEMSLVGPRPIIDSPTYDAQYVYRYVDEFEAYKSVRPGLTGMWQVECRNRGVYELRIFWDMYYIRNWCVWLDLYLIMRTIKVMLFREGR